LAATDGQSVGGDFVSVTEFTSKELEAIEDKWTLPRFLFFPAGLVGLWFIAHP
jgi:hypothetical protein